MYIFAGSWCSSLIKILTHFYLRNLCHAKHIGCLVWTRFSFHLVSSCNTVLCNVPHALIWGFFVSEISISDFWCCCLSVHVQLGWLINLIFDFFFLYTLWLDLLLVFIDLPCCLSGLCVCIFRYVFVVIHTSFLRHPWRAWHTSWWLCVELFVK